LSPDPNFFWFTSGQELGFQHFRYDRPFVYPSRIQDEYVIVLCFEGEIHVQEDGRNKVLFPGDVLIGNSRQWRTSRYGYRRQCQGLSLVVNRAVMIQTLRDLGHERFGDTVVPVFEGACRPKLTRIAEDVLAELHSSSAGRGQLLEALGREILIRSLRGWPGISAVNPGGPRRVLTRRHYVAALDYMQSCGKSDFSVGEMCRSVGLSSPEFARLFRASTGSSPLVMYNRLLVDRAQTALASGAGSVKEVAYSLGFDSMSHFAVLFRRFTGQSPSRLL
jgi:AraC-like DNA-binding protein